MRRQGRSTCPNPVGRFALLALAFPALASSPAQAKMVLDGPQTPVPPDPRPEDQRSPASSQQGLEEIVVTARRRIESAQRTPVSLVALSGDDLESRSLTNLRNLQYFVPNLTLAASQNVGESSGNAFIRGIGQEDFAAGAEPGVGFYVDGVYLGRTTGTLMNLTDVARIEVLRGPQGTLFGKNSIGGAINVVSVMPAADPGARLSLIIGNYDRVETRGIVNQPLSGNLFARLSLGIVSREGYLRRLPPPAPSSTLERVTDAPVNSEPEGADNSQAGRLQLRWLIGDTLTADLSVDGSHKRSTQGATHIDAIDARFGIFPQLNRLIREGSLPGPEIDGSFAPASLLESYASGRNVADLDVWGASAIVTRDFGAASLRFIAAWRGLRSRVGTDIDGLYFNITESDLPVRQQQFSGELQLTGISGGLAYTAGLFAFREDVRIPGAVSRFSEVLYTCGCFFTPTTQPQFTTDQRQIGSDSYAGYAQGTYAFGDGLSATLGARFSHEMKRIDGQVFRLDADLRPTNILVATGTNRDAWDSFTYRTGLEYQATQDLMIYGSVARGYKSGGFNVRAAPDLPNLGFVSFRPETALTYEIGLRSEWIDHRLRVNVTLFHTNYRDIQLRRQTSTGGIFTTLIENAARARIRGAEVEVTAAPVEGLTLSAAYGHLDPRYLDVGGVPGLTLASRFQRTPSHSLSASAHYEVPLGTGTLELHGDYSYRSREQFQLTASPFDQPAYGLLGARVTFRSRDDRWSAALFATNLTDERYRTAGRGTGIAQTGIAYSSVGLPRQWGLQLTAAF